MNSSRTAPRRIGSVPAESSPRTTGGKYPTWFGPSDAPFFGTVHVPSDGRARGGVVLCPPLGKEQVDSYRGMTLLAQKLSAQGLLVLRFDYSGTGDSWGDQDRPDAISHWQRSIVEAVEFVRGCGVSEVALVGLRVGALLACSVAAECGPLTAVTLWDPVVKGRSYLHEQRALYSVSVTTDSDADPRVSIIGAVLHPDSAAGFAALDATKTRTDAPVLIATRAERGDSKPIRKLVDALSADEHTLSGHDDFLEPSDFEVIIPAADIASLATWTAAKFPTEPTSDVRVQHRSLATVDDIHENIEFLGKQQLFAIRSSSDRCLPGGPTVVFYPTANEHRVGPVRMWVDLARLLPRFGISTVRFDRRGTGESGTVSDGELTRLYSDEGNEDALTAVQQSGTSPENVLVAGMCSGSWYSSFAARELGVRAAVLLNTLDWTTRRLEFVKRSSMHTEETGLRARALDRLHHWGVRTKNALQPRIPYALWIWLGRRGLIQVPEISLRLLSDREVQTRVLLSPTDTTWFETNRGPEGMRRLQNRTAAPSVTSFESGDHSLYGRDLRENVRAELIAATSAAFDVEITAPSPPVPVGRVRL
ncbi:alpha/beta fold hydrolase [Rhodococcus sp. NPDC078407]|uniref:alpha/beta fold hydrolase n=1 Tax=Rhodococcus sp. NPDC078407 TaxID=3364509 RepID=UPI0037C7BF96